MKYVVKVENEFYEVEIADLAARPITTVVNGTLVEVWPESEALPAQLVSSRVSMPGRASGKPSIHTTRAEIQAIENHETIERSSVDKVLAPLPGVIVSIAVSSGDKVEIGQELCVLEAMKMKNSIRSSRSGTISDIIVSVGETVNHSDVLMEFSQ
jgi:biotin carboxyl carrier protein